MRESLIHLSRRFRPLVAIATILSASALLLHSCSGSDCVDVETQISEVCLPDAITANQPAVLDVRESCGALCAQAPSCTAILLSGAIYLTLTEAQCSVTSVLCIQTQCLESTAPCSIPELDPGDYSIVVKGGPPAVLHVRAQGVSGCHLPEAPIGPDAGTDGGTPDAGE